MPAAAAPNLPPLPRPLAARMTRAPVPHDAGVAADTAATWADLPPDLRALVAGSAAGSPYLAGLIGREAAWLRVALTLAPETALNAVLAPLDTLAPDALAEGLRCAKRRVALLAALCDLSGAWELMQVTGALTALADRAMHLSLTTLVAEEIRRGRLPGAAPDHAADAGGMVALAMGKMGAGELNYSSDIDLVCLFDETRYPGVEQEARASFIRVTRRMCAMLSDLTPGGYVFRTDLRLRPDAAVTPVCLSMAAAEAYYEAEGRTWERAAYIKARPCGGDIAAGERFLRTLAPFVWRRHLDFAAIQDAHDMRLRIRDHRGLHGAIQLPGHDMKLGRGGIREIEFFTQTRQLIAGGRDPGLRDRTTLGGLAALAAKGWVPAAIARDLSADYIAHREVEHRIQMVNDAQTHDMPASDDGIDRIAHLSGEGDVKAFRTRLLDRLRRVEDLTGAFFSPGETAEGPALSEAAKEVVDRWKGYPALRSDRARALFRRLRPALLARLGRAANPDEALAAFDSFLKGLPAGVQVFSLFDANPQLIDLMGDIVSVSPALARHLARNAGVLDAVIGGSFFAPWPGAQALAADLAAALAEVPDYEKRLDRARVWQREWHFRVGVHHLRGVIDAFEAGKQYADLAEAAIAALWPVVGAEFARKHGAAPGRGAVVLGMGSLGAARLNAGSDLDLIMIYDDAGQEASEGPRPLASRAYFARLTQATVTALTAPTAEGRLYEVDMRLRPSGRQGPVATSLASFAAYQMDEAWTWEHLALTRARVLAGDAGLAGEVEAVRRQVLAAKGQGDRVLPDVADMRARLRAAKPAAGGWGGPTRPRPLMGIELLAQTCALRAGDPARRVEAQLRAGLRSGFLSGEQESALLLAYRLCWRLHAGTRLLTDRPLEMEKLGEGGRAFLARETGEPDAMVLIDHLTPAVAAAAAVIADRLPETGGEEDATRN
ncbi:MAG TPA: glutamine-synthetase adenylyltransferase [Paracoccaceae bacterium]|nr:glutamine-synthetase adenylyltransferase [Paracoccaceae bacterium]